jgi:hypothetical protein
MSEANYSLKREDHWANQIWNLSLLPLGRDDDAGLLPSHLENAGAARSQPRDIFRLFDRQPSARE